MNRGIKLSLETGNLNWSKLSYIYRKLGIKPRNSNVWKKTKLERSITGFEGRVVKDEWKSRFISKQLLKTYYNLSEKEYKVLRQDKGLYGGELVEYLETKLDVILFRLGWVNSLEEAAHIIKKGKILITDNEGNWMNNPIKYRDIYLKIGTLIKMIDSENENDLIKIMMNKKRHIITNSGFKSFSWVRESDKGIGMLISKPIAKEVKLSIPFNIAKA